MALSSFTFNPNQFQLVLTFDQPTTLTRADLANFTLQNAANNPTVSFALTNSILSSGEGTATQHTISIWFYTIRNITIQTTGLTNSSNTFLSTTFPTAVTVPVTTYTPFNGAFIRVYRFISPNILRFDCSPSSPINIDPTAITLSSSDTGTPSHTLTGGTVTVNGYFTYLELTDADVAALNAISFNPAVSGQAYLSSTAGAWDEWYVPSPAQTNRSVSSSSEQYSLSAELNMTDTGVLVAENEGVGTPTNRNIVTVQDNYVYDFVRSGVFSGGGGLLGPLAYGDDVFVLIRSGPPDGRAIAWTSPDGATWTQTTQVNAGGASSVPWNRMAYGNGRFVAVAGSLFTNSDTTAISTDSGMTWTVTAGALPATANWVGVAYGAGVWVAVSGSGPGGTATNIAATSSDGITWTQQTLPATALWTSLTYGDGLFVATTAGPGGSQRVATSPDGITWTDRATALPADQWSSVAYGGGQFVAVAGGGASSDGAATSPDGITWTQQTLPVSSRWANVTYGNGFFLAVSLSTIFFPPGNAVVAYSADGITWTQATIPENATAQGWNTVAYGAGRFVAVPTSQASPFDNVLRVEISDSNLTQISGVTNISQQLAVTNLVVTGNSNLGSIANVQITDGTEGQFIQTNGSGELSFSSPTDWDSVANIAVGDIFVGSAVGTTAAGGLAFTAPNVTDSGGGNSTAAPDGGYRCLGGIGATECLWVRTF